MKKQVILYSGTILIVFLSLYIRNLNSAYYPVTSTFGIEGKKVSYKLDKIYYGQNNYRVVVLSDIPGVKGNVYWRYNGSEGRNEFKENGRSLISEIPSLKPGRKLKYRIELYYQDQAYEIPKNNFIDLIFFGKIPSFVVWMHYIFLIGGLIFSVRTALEVFNEKSRSKKLAMISSVFFIFYTIINPLKNSYKLGAINNLIPSINNLFDTQTVVFLLISLSGTFLIFKKSTSTAASVITAAALILILFLFPFNL